MTQNTIDYFWDEHRFLSNFDKVPISYEGITYPTSENAFQAAKSLNPDIRKEFVNLTPGQAKKKGRHIDLRPDWETVKLQIMEDILRIKFTTPRYKQLLLNTGDAVLIEGNTWNDTYWGVCNGVGENHLGQLLMKIRNEINK